MARFIQQSKCHPTFVREVGHVDQLPCFQGFFLEIKVAQSGQVGQVRSDSPGKTRHPEAINHWYQADFAIVDGRHGCFLLTVLIFKREICRQWNSGAEVFPLNPERVDGIAFVKTGAISKSLNSLSGRYRIPRFQALNAAGAP
jgi:hypothetical protein